MIDNFDCRDGEACPFSYIFASLVLLLLAAFVAAFVVAFEDHWLSMTQTIVVLVPLSVGRLLTAIPPPPRLRHHRLRTAMTLIRMDHRMIFVCEDTVVVNLST